MSTQPKVYNIIDSLRNKILSGEFGEGKIPPFRELVTEYQTSQETMNKAIQALQAEGLLLSSGVKGVFVNIPRIRMPKIVKNFYNYLKEEGFDPKEEVVIGPEIINPTPDIAKNMLLSKNELVVRRFRKQGTNTFPLRLVDSYFPKSLVTDETFEEAKKDPHYSIIADIKRNFEKTVQYVHEEIIARLPTVEEQEQLKIVRTNPIINIKFTNYTSNEKKEVIMYTDMVLNANHFLISYESNVTHWD